MTDREQHRRRLGRQMTRVVTCLFESPKYAAELEAKGQIVSDFPPSRYALGSMLKVQPPDVYRSTVACNQQELRDAEAVAFHDNRPELAGRIAFYRHARFEADHPDGYLGELFGALVPT